MLQSFARFLTWYAHDLLARIQFYRMADKHRGLFFNINSYGTYTTFTPDAACKLDPVLLADDVFITRIEWCKKNQSPFHEFLVVYVQERDKNNGQIPRRAVIAIERNVGKPVRKGEDDDKDDIIDGTEELIFTKLDGTIIPPPTDALPRVATVAQGVTEWSSSSSKRVTLSAADNLYFTNDGTAGFVTNIVNKWFNYKVCRTLHIVGEHFTVPQLVLLTSVAHNHWRTYRLFDYQCFWYAHVIYTTITGLVSMASSRGKSGWYEVDHKQSLDVAQFRFSERTPVFKVQRGATGTSETVKDKYLIAWVEYKNEMAACKVRKDKEHIEAARPQLQALEDTNATLKDNNEALKDKLQAAEEKLQQEKKATEERLQQEKKAAEERLQQEKKATERAQQEKKAAEERLQQEKKAAEERLQQEKKAAERAQQERAEQTAKLMAEIEHYRRLFQGGSGHQNGALHIAS